MSDELSREEYDELRTELSTAAIDRIDAGADPEEALWEIVGGVVPQLTRPVCDAIVDYSEHAPLDALVEQVTAQRESSEDEHRRAEAITVLLQEVDEVVAEEGKDSAGFA